MAKKVEGTFADAWKPKEKGMKISGIYLGVQKGRGDKGEFNAYHFKSEDGKRFSVAGAGLDNIMPCVPKKTLCALTYMGTQTLGKGEMKIFEVLVPDDVTLLDPFDSDEEHE